MTASDEKNHRIENQTEAQLREVAFIRMIERGIEDSDQGRTIDHDEMARIIASWGK